MNKESYMSHQYICSKRQFSSIQAKNKITLICSLKQRDSIFKSIYRGDRIYFTFNKKTNNSYAFSIVLSIIDVNTLLFGLLYKVEINLKETKATSSTIKETNKIKNGNHLYFFVESL